MFNADLSDLKRLERFFKKMPELIRPATANFLNSLAFQTRDNDVKNITSMMIIRDMKFMEKSLIVQKTKSVRIEQQIAYAGSTKRPRFTGWQEQETGATTPKKRSPTKYARGGNVRSVVGAKYRYHKIGKLARPEQFQGKNIQQRFMFMMRILGSKGAGFFHLDAPFQLKSRTLTPGLYYLRHGTRKKTRHGILKRIQSRREGIRPRRSAWRTRSLQQLQNMDMNKIWARSMSEIVSRYKKV